MRSHIGSRDIPYLVLTMLFILDTDNGPSAMVLLSFATSLVYLGCASLGIWCAGRELAIMGTLCQRAPSPGGNRIRRV